MMNHPYSLMRGNSDRRQQGQRAAFSPKSPQSNEMPSNRILTPTQERALLAAYLEGGDRGALNRLIKFFDRLVLKYARPVADLNHMDVQDLAQEGRIGLFQAIESFDLSVTTKLASFAIPFIQGRIADYARSQSRCFDMGKTRAGRTVFSRLGEAERALREAGADITAENVAEYLGLPGDERTQRALAAVLSWSTPIEGGSYVDEEDNDSGCVLSEERTPESLYADKEVEELVVSAVRTFGNGLEGLEYDIFWKRLNCEPEDRETLDTLGAQHGVSFQRVGQVESSLRSRMAKELSYLREEL